MTTGTIGRIVLAVEPNGKPYYVTLPQDRLQMLVQLAESLSDDGKLPVRKAPQGHVFQEVKPA